MNVITAKLQRETIKCLIIGPKGCGKSTLARSFQEDEYCSEENGNEQATLVKAEFIKDVYVRYELLEHDSDANEIDEGELDAILLVYDEDTADMRQLIKTKYCPIVNAQHSKIPLFLVRTKCESVTADSAQFGREMATSIHAAKFLECSAKVMNGVRFVFLEIYRTVKQHRDKLRERSVANPCSAPTSIGCFLGMVANSGPLFKQAYTNARECVINPHAFTEEKRTVQSWLPFIDFGLPSEPEAAKKPGSSNEVEEKTQKEDDKENDKPNKNEKHE